MGRQGIKEEPYCEIIGWGKIGESNLELCVLNAYGNENILKAEGIIPYMNYETFISFYPNKNKSGIIQGSLHQDTVFGNNTVEPSYLPTPIPERQEFIKAHIEPIVKLAEAKKRLSSLVNSSFPFVDRTDLRIIKVNVVEVRTGRQRNGIDWASIGVTDSTFIPTHEHKAFNIWCDPSLIKITGIKKGSYAKIIGAIQFDARQKNIEMVACSVIPENSLLL